MNRPLSCYVHSPFRDRTYTLKTKLVNIFKYVPLRFKGAVQNLDSI